MKEKVPGSSSLRITTWATFLLPILRPSPLIWSESGMRREGEGSE